MLIFRVIGQVLLLICVSSVFSIQLKDGGKEINLMAHAISDVLANFAADDDNRINIRTHFFETQHLKDLKNAIIKKINNRFTYEVKNDLHTFEFYPAQSSIILLKSIDLIKVLIKKTQVFNDFPKHLKFLIYCENATFEEYKKVKKIMYQIKLNLFEGPFEQMIYFIFEHNGIIGLSTISWFRTSSCNVPSLSIVRFFNKNTLTWEENLHKFEKFTHFYGCELIMPVGIETGTEFNVEGKSEKEYKLGKDSDLEITLLEILAKKHNFTVKIQRILTTRIIELFGGEETLYFDETFKEQNYPTVFFKIFYPYNEIYSRDLRRFAHYTTPFFESKIIFLVTPGELYTAYEKLYLPFDEPTWVLIFITFGAAFAVIFLVNFTSKPFQVLVYGHGVKIPSLNVVGTFFGIGQTKLPDLSFSRFILMMFILFCLIIRTAYQGVLFELMTSQPRRPEPKDFQGLIDQNYKMYTNIEIENFTWEYLRFFGQKIEFKKRLFIKITEDEALKIYGTQWNNGSAKLSLILQNQDVPLLNLYSGDFIPWIQLEESYQTILYPFAFFPNHFLYQITNDAVQRLTSAGIMQHLYDNYIKQDLKYEKKFIEESEPQVFALSDLDFGFYVWLGTCAVAIFVFLIELLGWLPKKYGMKEISKGEIRNEVKNFIEDLGEVYENDAVEGLSKELSAPFSNDKNVTKITTEDLNEIEEIKIESRRMSENSDHENFAKIHPTNDNSKQKFKAKSLTKE